MASRIQMIQGSSVAPEVVEQVRRVASSYKRVLIFLDSNHTHDHVLAELEAYGPLTSIGSYCVAFDTIAELRRIMPVLSGRILPFSLTTRN